MCLLALVIYVNVIYKPFSLYSTFLYTCEDICLKNSMFSDLYIMQVTIRMWPNSPIMRMGFT